MEIVGFINLSQQCFIEGTLEIEREGNQQPQRAMGRIPHDQEPQDEKFE